MYLYILLDTSGSMEGAKIGALNDSMSNLIADLQSNVNDKLDILLSVLAFSRDTKWMYKESIAINDFVWEPLSAGGMTSLGKACCELSVHLGELKVYNEPIVIILLSDGCPTDDYEEGLLELHKLNNFNNAIKYAIALGDNADISSLISFTSNSDNVFFENNSDSLLDALQSVIANIIYSTGDSSNLAMNMDDDEWS